MHGIAYKKIDPPAAGQLEVNQKVRDVCSHLRERTKVPARMRRMTSGPKLAARDAANRSV